jgi:hypothetical protein
VTGDIVINSNGNQITVLKNISGTQTNKFIKISKNALSPKVPEDDLYITKGHPVLVDGIETPVEKLINGRTIINVTINAPEPVYSLCTRDRVFVNMQGCNVCTWSLDEFLEYRETNFVSVSEQ